MTLSDAASESVTKREVRKYFGVGCIYLDGAPRPGPRPTGANRKASPPPPNRAFWGGDTTTRLAPSLSQTSKLPRDELTAGTYSIIVEYKNQTAARALNNAL